MKSCLLILGLLCTLNTFATHIVGGEIDMQAITNEGNATHRITLNLYFDDLNGNKQAEDNFVTIGIFRKRDNYMMGILTMPKVSTQQITYANPICSSTTQSQTRQIKYSGTAILSPQNFDDSMGYYIAWERCCRNSTITNIQNPGAAGSTFYLEFPAFKQENNNILANSTPQFVIPSGDYSCINRPFSMNFAAKDADGDSLAYSLVTPLNGYSSTAASNPTYPTPSSDYPPVKWISGISLDNVIPGSSPLKVNPKTGLLTVTANTIGLYVFCVQVDEYRKGKKIGSVRRDYQLKVIDCLSNDTPVTVAREQGKSSNYQKGQIITIKHTQKPKCIALFSTDKNVGQHISIKLQPVNFSDSTFKVSPASLTIKTVNDTLKTSVCFNECNVSWDNKPLIFDVITSDNGCPQVLTDTLRISVLVEPDPLALPRISTDLGATSATVTVGNKLGFTVLGSDSLKNTVKISATGRGFSLNQVGMSFSSATGVGKVTSPFTWTPTCAVIRKEDYIIDFVVSEERCGRTLTDTITIRLKVVDKENKRPKISTTLGKKSIDYTLSNGNASINFDVIGEDTDLNDLLNLYAVPQGFDLKAVGMGWNNLTGKVNLRSPFTWLPTCELLEGKESKTFAIQFVVQDNSCGTNNMDTTTVSITIKNKTMDFSFKPANIFTPNDDGKNDYFSIPDLPEDNCFEHFKNFQVVNRWGDVVYETSNRNFKWYGENSATGDYFYIINFTSRQFKGWLTLLR